MKRTVLFFIAAPVCLLALLLAACDTGQVEPTATLAGSQATPATGPSATAALTPQSPAGSATSSTTPGSDLVAAARHLIDQLASGDYTGAEATFDPTMKQELPADKLSTVWQQMTTQEGAYKGPVGTQTASAQGYNIVTLTLQFANSNVNARVVFDGQGRIAGLFFSPTTDTGTPLATPVFTPAPYVTPSAFTERDVTVGSGEWALPGTLSMPVGNGPFPAVVLVHGSGPEDRDESIGANKPFRDLAQGLASQGIAVLRYDKRTYTYQSKMAALANSITVKEEVTDDASAAVALLKGTQGVDPNKVFVLGHSLGGLLSPMIVSDTQGVAGLIMLAAPSRPFEDTIMYQYTYLANLDGQVTADEQKQLDQLKQQVANVKSPSLSASTPADTLPLGISAAYWLSLRAYNQTQTAAALHQPILALQGESDYQVTMDDLNGWKQALAGHINAQFKSYPGLSHLFMPVQGTPGPDNYNVAGHMQPDVVSDIAIWIKQH